MSALSTFFTFSFISTLAVAILATGWRYLPTLIALFQFQLSYPESKKLSTRFAR